MQLFWRFIYPVVYTKLLAIYWIRQWFRRREGKAPAPWLPRMGILPASLRKLPSKSGPRLWIHAVSVGEVNVIKPLIEQLDLEPSQLFISTVTVTGQELARDLYGDHATIFYFPLDWRFSCRRYLQAIDPDVVALTETELWPGFILAAHARRVALALINGRLSNRSFKSYRRVAALLRPVLECIDRFCMQSRQDKERIIALGAPQGRTNHTGNLKYDYVLAGDSEKEQLVDRLEQLLKPDPESRLWVCGSTREEEEKLLLPVFGRVRQRFPELRLLLAPRHPHRAGEVEKLVNASGWSCRRRSQIRDWGKASDAPDVLVLDSIGELAHIYRLADVVFVGGSLVPWGGHNIIEAANFSKPILFGPHVQNFQDITQTFLDRYAALQVQDPEELGDRLIGLLEDESARKWLGRNARKVIRENQGAVDRTLEIICDLMQRNAGGTNHQPKAKSGPGD